MKNVFLASIVLVVAFIPFPQALSTESISVPTPLERAKELINANKPASALQALSSYQPSHDEVSIFHSITARALVGLKHHYESIEHYRLAYLYAKTPAEKERLLFERAEVYAGMGYFSEAAVCFEGFLKVFPRSSFAERAQLGIAEARFKLGEFHAALAHYAKSGTSRRALLGRANTLQALKKNAEAHELFHALIEQDPEFIRSSPETMFNIGENYRLTGRLHDAQIFFESVKDPVFKYRAAQGLGLIAMEEKRFNAALAAFTTAADSPERTIRCEATLNRADAHMRMGKYDAAQAALLDIKKNYPYGRQYDTAVLLLAKLYRAQGKFNESLTLLKELIFRRSPVSGALDELETIVLEAKDRDPDQFVKLWNTAGHWLLDPSRSSSIIKIAQGLRHAGKPFLDTCSWLIKYGPEDAKAEGRLLLADFYAELGDAAAAQNYLKRANRTGRDDMVLRINAKIFLAAGDARNASISIRKIRKLSEADLLLLLDAMMLLKNNETETAFCEQALKKETASLKTLVRFADILYAAGNRKKALVYYRAAVAAKSEQALKGDKTSADADWAYYRISLIAEGADATNSLKAIQTAKNPVGRFAAAELKGSVLRRKAE